MLHETKPLYVVRVSKTALGWDLLSQGDENSPQQPRTTIFDEFNNHWESIHKANNKLSCCKVKCEQF